jgi:hypothetical protein
MRQDVALCGNCASIVSKRVAREAAGPTAGLWISSAIGLATALLIAGFFVLDAGSTTADGAAAITGGIAIQIACWYLGRWFIRRRPLASAWVVLAVSLLFVCTLVGVGWLALRLFAR